MNGHLLTIVTLLPLAGALVVLLLPASTARAAALASTGVTGLVTAAALMQFDAASPVLQLMERAAWIPTLHIDYVVGVDGFSVGLLALTAILTPVVVLASRRVVDRARSYFALVLLLQTALFGAFTAQSFFLWFLHWELSLVPAFFLVKLWGGPNASRAALAFFLYTLVGSILLLLAFQALFLATGTFDFIELRGLAERGALGQQLVTWAASAGFDVAQSTVETIAFLMIATAFFIKTPMWPLHTWLPDTYAEAPAPVTMMLTGALSKLGVYGLLRLALPLFPQAADRLSGVLTAFAAITIVAGALSALFQTDLKRTMAYSSMSHVGYCLLGAFAAASVGAGAGEARAVALDGAVVQMFNHGISGAALFYFVHLLEERTTRRGIGDFGGLRTSAPLLSFAFVLVLFGSLGLPALSGFVGELLVFKGALALHPLWTAVAAIGLITTAVYCLRIVQRVCWGPVAGRGVKPPEGTMTDLDGTERLTAFALCALILVGGVWPGPFVHACNAAVQALVTGGAP